MAVTDPLASLRRYSIRRRQAFDLAMAELRERMDADDPSLSKADFEMDRINRRADFLMLRFRDDDEGEALAMEHGRMAAAGASWL